MGYHPPHARPRARPRRRQRRARAGRLRRVEHLGQLRTACDIDRGKSALAPPASAHPATRAQSADTVCRAFTYRLAVGPLHKGINQLVPGDGRVLYAELEGLSRRLEFTPAAPARHAGLYRLAAVLDRAAIMAQALPAAPTRSAFAHSVPRLRGQLEEASALAARLALPDCRIALRR